MMIFQYIILGIIQGITEPIPVSSSGHLMVFRNLFNTNMFNDLNFEIVANFGSFLAILFIYRKDIVKLFKGFFGYIFKKDKRVKYKDDFKYTLLIAIACIPVGIVGILFKDILEKQLNTLTIVGIAFLITALCLTLVSNIKGHKDDKDITFLDAILVGLLQAIAIVPGISRSGSTLVGCLLRGFKREAALKFSFLLYFPVSIATMGLSLVDILKEGSINEVILPYSLGMIAACITTYFATHWLFKVVKKGKLWKFAIYCLLLGLFVLIFM